MFFHRDGRDPLVGEWCIAVGETRVVALLMVAAGCALFVALLHPELVPIPIPPDISAYLGLFLFKGGLLAFFSVTGISVDLRAKAAFRWVRILGLRALETRSKVASFEDDEVSGIRVDHTPVDLVVTRLHRWHVRLLPGPSGGQALEQFGSPLAALSLGREVAAFLGVPLNDAAMGTERQIAPEELHRPLYRRLAEEGGGDAALRAPFVTRAEGLEADLPPGGLRRDHVGAVALGGLLSMAFFVLLRPWSSPGADLPSILVTWAVVLWPLPLPLAVALVATRQWTRVRVDERGLAVTRPWGPLHVTVLLPHGELRDLLLLEAGDPDPARGFVFPGDGMIVARSERSMLRFGSGLSREDLGRLHGAAANAITKFSPQ